MAYLEISDLVNLYYTIDGNNLKELLEIKIKSNKRNYKDNAMVTLPEIITSFKDIYYFILYPQK